MCGITGYNAIARNIMNDRDLLLFALKDAACIFYALSCGWFDALQGIADAKTVVFENAKRVIGKHFNTLDILECVEERAKFLERGIVVCDARQENVTNPDGFANIAQVASAIEDIFITVQCEAAVCLIVDVLDIKEYRIGESHEPFEL